MMGLEIEKLEHMQKTEKLPFEDGVPKALLEKLDETYGLDEEDFPLDAEKLAESTEPPNPDLEAQSGEVMDRWVTLAQRRCWEAGFPGQYGFKYL